METIRILHFIQAAIILFLSGGLLWHFRNDVRKQSFLRFWLWACALWALYYTLKGIGLVDTWVSEGEPVPWGQKVKLFGDILLCNINSLFIVFAAIPLKPGRKVSEELVLLGLTLTAAVTILAALILSVAFPPERCAALFLLTWPTSVASAFVLVFFYHRFSRMIPNAPVPLLPLPVWFFVGYAFLQREYPYLFGESGVHVKATSLYLLALVFKVACTVLIFYCAQESFAKCGWGAHAPQDSGATS